MVTSAGLSSGTLSRWNDERGFGFISPGSDQRSVFVHISAFPRGSRRPAVGDEVHYLLETTPEGKVRAAGVSYVAGSRTPTRSSRGVARSSGSYVVVFAFVALLAGVVMAWEPPLWVPALYLIASLVTFVAYAADKAAARSGGWRVSEGSLLLLGMIGGWPGAIVAQQRLRHKTVKQSFRVLFWMTVLVNIGALLYFTAPGMTHRFLELMM